MGLQFRPIRQDELPRLAEVNLTAFGENLGPWHEGWFDSHFEGALTMAAFEDGVMVGSSMSLRITVTVPGARVAAAGVTAVGVLPTHRRRGILRQMMERLLEEVRSRRLPLAVLWASEGGIYSRFGFGPAARSLGMELQHPKASLLPRPSTGRLRLVSLEHARQILPAMHERVVSQRPGMIARDQVGWQYALSNEDPHAAPGESRLFAVVHESDLRADGYLVYRIRGEWSSRGPENTLVVVEMVAETPDATAALWRYCTEVDLVRRIEAKGRGARPVDDPIWWLLADPQALVATFTTTLWARVLDVPALLEARRYRRDGALTLALGGGYGSSPSSYRLEIEGGIGRCRATDGPADIQLGWPELGSLSLGMPCLSQLVVAGRARATGTEVAREAEAILGWDPAPWCFEDI
ncbi:MAG: GNAT family N-acetyltransferase [Candidatus Dormibacteraeota bacterium]|nr:GNAT family N-acetyltransferase [Candidatus Dormibacteraeota bacterium]